MTTARITTAKITRRELQTLMHAYSGVARWAADHVELCEEKAELRKLDRDNERVCRIIDQLRARMP